MDITKLCEAVDVFYKIAQQTSGSTFEQLKPLLIEKMKSALEKWKIGIQRGVASDPGLQGLPISIRISVYAKAVFAQPEGQILQAKNLTQVVEMKSQPDYFRLENGKYVPRKAEELSSQERAGADALFGKILEWGNIGYNLWDELDQNTIQQISTILKRSQGPVTLMFPEAGDRGPGLAIDVRPSNPEPPQKI